MACSALPATSPLATKEAYVIHTPPSAHNPRPSKRNTVHWPRHDRDVAVKENTIPDHHTNSPKLHKSHQYSQETLLDLRYGDRKLRGRHPRSQLVAETFVAPQPLEPSGAETASGIDTDLDQLGLHDLVRAARQLNPDDNIFEKHRLGQYQWVLSLPASELTQPSDHSSSPGAQDIPGEGDRRYFGCNLLDWTKPAGKGHRLPGDPEDKYILLATPIDLDTDQSTSTNVEFTTHQFRVIQEHTQTIDMAASPLAQRPSDAVEHAHQPSPLSAASNQWSTAAKASEDGDDTLTIDPPPVMRAPPSTIDDTFQQMEQFKDEIDAITAAAYKMSLNNDQDIKEVGHEKHQTPSKTADASLGSSVVSSARNGDKAESDLNFPSASDQDVGRKPPTATLRRVARPASLLPPKPIQKATKQPTISTFELPGERVARELKEKKAARLSMQADSPKAPEAYSPQRTRSIRSSKPPTVPNFELPGERLSRQKKERFEQLLKEQEDQARQRRQFKARPSPASAAPTVRSTFTSRQRQNQGPSEQGGVLSPVGDSSPRAGTCKRQSMTMTPSTARTVSISSAATTSTTDRGRANSTGQTSTRATSSVGSVASGGRRDSVSFGELQQQKARGRQIYNRDCAAGRSKEQEKRDREEAIKVARQKYAQMSRNLAATSRARRSQQQSSSSTQGDLLSASPKGKAPQVPKHRELYAGRNF
ncbi:unnamed protein product [Discula destructiva]